MKLKKLFFLLLILFFPFCLQAQVTYYNFEDFKNAAKVAQPGDEIILAEGRYEAESITLESIAGTESQPIILRAENIGTDTLDIGTYFDLRHCSYITIQGFYINISEKSTTFKIQTCDHIRITQNILDGTNEPFYKDDGVSRNSSVWISIQSLYNDLVNLSHHNQVDHNLIKNKHTLGNAIRIDGTDELYVSQYDRIEFNHFKNIGPRAENEMETIRIGWSAMSQSDGYTTVSNNLFTECNGDPEIISVKCNKNIISHNTFRRCEGTLSLRHGNLSIVEGNFFLGEGAEGTGGVRIYGSDHLIINNYFEGLTGTKWDAPITLTEGDAEEGSTGLTKHFRIERAIIANNTLVNNDFGIEIGYDNNGSYSKPPRDVVFAYNVVVGDTNTLVNYINQPDNMTWIDNIMYPTDDAVLASGVTFTTEQVSITNPALLMDESLGYYKSTALTPNYSPSIDLTGIVNYDIDGQYRSVPTNHGADEFSESALIYKPLSDSDVGPSLGEYMSVSSSLLEFPVAGGSRNFSLSTNLNWTISNENDWIHLNKLSGSGDDIIEVSLDENTTGAIRTGIILVQSTNISNGDEITRSVLVSQSETDPPVLTLSEDTLKFTSDAGNQIFTITSNVSWTITADKTWVSVDISNGSSDADISLSVEKNENRAERKAIITITDGVSSSAEILVIQEGETGTEVKLMVDNVQASTEQVDGGNIATNVIDGILTNRWSGDGDGAYITLDLGALANVSFLKVGLYKGADRLSYFDILSSTDGVNFDEAIMNITSELTSEPLVIYDFTDREARYVRLVGHGNSTSTWNSYTELEIWGWPITQVAAKDMVNDHAQDIKIYPNPSNGNFIINNTEASKIFIIDGTGKIVLQKEKVYGDLKIESLDKGIYFISIVTEQVRKTGKLVVY